MRIEISDALGKMGLLYIYISEDVHVYCPPEGFCIKMGRDVTPLRCFTDCGKVK